MRLFYIIQLNIHGTEKKLSSEILYFNEAWIPLFFFFHTSVQILLRVQHFLCRYNNFLKNPTYIALRLFETEQSAKVYCPSALVYS
jgi:hypothetical protein